MPSAILKPSSSCGIVMQRRSKEETLLQHPEWFIAGTHYIPVDELAKFGATGR